MRAFSVGGGTVEEFVARVRDEIRAREFQDIASVGASGDVLEVRFSWMGTSILKYLIRPSGDGFQAVLTEQKMSPFHAPFKSSFEERFDSILARVGAKPA